jgi:trehalose 6-phosphate synthase
MLNAEHIYTVAQSDEAQSTGREVRSLIHMSDTGQLILRVDRMEPTKNIINGFQAYDRMLKTHPELYKRVTFLALFIPSRQHLAEYRSYERQVRDLIADINTRHGLQGWQPIVAAFGNNRARALACLQDYDVLFVNPVIDGLNLVVKEGGLLNKRSGVIILSRTAGAHTTLKDHVLTIAPLDIDATAEVLFQALKMPTAERMRRANMIREILLQEDATAWLETQIKTLSGI